MISVACDICGQNYELSDKLHGKLQRCRECDTRFEVSEENAPLELDSNQEGAGESDWAGVWRVMRGIVAGITILISCGWMTSLLFRDPWDRQPVVFRNSTSSSSTRTVRAQHFNSSQSAAVPANPAPLSGTPAPFAPPVAEIPNIQTPPANVPSVPHVEIKQRLDEVRKRHEERLQRIQSRMTAPPGTASPPNFPPIGPGDIPRPPSIPGARPERMGPGVTNPIPRPPRSVPGGP